MLSSWILFIFIFFLPSPVTPPPTGEELVLRSQIQTLKSCEHNSRCLENFFKNYTIKNGFEKSLSFFKELTEKDDSLIYDCHYMFHGIGHGELENNKGDVGQTFSALKMDKEILFKYPTCPNGYYHGIIEKFAGDIKNKKILSEKLSKVCNNVPKLNLNDCYHGIGHAAYLQLDANLDEAILTCDNISEEIRESPDFEKLKGSCHAGVFMQASSDYNSENNKVMSLVFCDSLKKDIYQAECYNQSSYLFEEFLKDKDKFLKVLKHCKTFKDQEERVTCVRMGDH